MNVDTRICQNCKQSFTIESDDFDFYKKIEVPPPTFCSECRFQMRLASRNERFLYRRQCALCKKSILSIYASEKPYIVYCPECWWSDKWDPLSYGREYDFSKSFFEQYAEFKKSVPHEAVYHRNFVNSEYSNFGLNYKDCYLVFGGWDNERLYYGNSVGNVRDSLDITFGRNIELSYEVISSTKGSKLKFCRFCDDSNKLTLCIDCRSCTSCIGCVGLRGKQYYILNKPYSKEEYEKKVKSLNLGSYAAFQQFRQRFSDFALTQPYRASRFKNAIDCTGDNIIDSKNSKKSFELNKVEDAKYLLYGAEIKDSQDCLYVGTGGAELLYQISSSFGGHTQVCGIRTLFDQNAYYSEDCHNCENIFGCIGVKKKSYCIFNKQYSPDEYETLRKRIVSQFESVPYADKKGRTYHFGDYWPIELGPFGYNETKAQEFMLIEKELALQESYPWRDPDSRNYGITIKTDDLPDHISDVPKSILDDIIECAHKGTCKENCTTAFKILPLEFELYKRIDVPLPRLCPNCRYMERLKRQNPPQLWKRSCTCAGKNDYKNVYANTIEHFHGENHCPNSFETSYAPDRPEIVYCEQCYQAEVV